jgi:formylglycine-generating enzyme required for sulfatase activity
MKTLRADKPARFCGLFVIWMAVLLLPAGALGAQEKYALVIGNAAYTIGTRLNNTVNDAKDMKAVLEGLGFQVDLLTDAGRVRIEEAVERFKNKLARAKNSYGFLFYAGHGVQSGGENYLIPVDADIRSESYLRDRAVSVQAVLDELNAAGNALNIVVLDACRTIPVSWSRSSAQGLRAVSNQPADSIIVYATSAGSTASDGTGRNGVFTGQLLKNLKIPGLEVTEVFRRTGGDVTRVSGGAQRPAIYIQFFDLAYLGTKPAAAQTQPAPAPTPAVVTPAAPPAAPPAQTARAGMALVPAGTFMMGSNDGYDDEKPVHRVTISKPFYMGVYEVTQKEWREVMGTTVRQQRDMGNTSWSLYGEGDSYPMYYVSWHEAIEYCNRRSVKEGLTPAYSGSGNSIQCNFNASGYRLPTEAEWEWAARGGGKDPLEYTYSGSNSVDTVAWYGSNSGNSTHSVGTKWANSLGIYDLSGNVFEWCWDWYGSYGSGSATDPLGAASGSYRVVRGGCWNISLQYVRSANRSLSTPTRRSDNVGFRVVRP